MKCRDCGKESDELEPVMIPEDTTANKLAVLQLCPECRRRRTFAGKSS